MSNAAVTPQYRALGWNVHFLAGSDRDQFAGLFHPPISKSLTYRDAIDELRLCFDLYLNSDTTNTDPWTDIAFAYEGALPSLTEDGSIPDPPGLICGQYLDEPLSTLPSESELSPPPIVRLHIVRHADCSIGSIELLAAHLRAGCAKHIPYPSLRRDDRYLPPNRPSKDVNITRLPYRKTIRSSRGSRSPPKRSVSGSVSPNKDNTHASAAMMT